MYILNVIFGDVMSVKLISLLFEDENPKNPEQDSEGDEDMVVIPTTKPDPTIQAFIDTNIEKVERIENLNELKLFDILMENPLENPQNPTSRTRSGSEGQSKAKEILEKLLPKEDFEVESNNEGSTSEDITIFKKIKNKDPLCFIEIKNIKNINQPISFFDKTISEKTKIGGTFLNLTKSILRKNLELNKFTFQKRFLQRSVYNLFKDIQNIDSKALKFSDLPEDLKQYLDLDKEKKNLPHSFNPIDGITMFSSHEPTNLQDKTVSNIEQPVAFYVGDNKDIKRIYLQLKETHGNKEINTYSYVSVEKKNDTNGNEVFIPLKSGITYKTIHTTGKSSVKPRRVGTSGIMSSNYFRLNKENTSDFIKTKVLNVIKEQYTNVNYFGVVINNQLKLIRFSENNPLQEWLPPEIGIFSEKNIRNIKLRPAGTADVGELRVAVECNIDYEGFIILT